MSQTPPKSDHNFLIGSYNILNPYHAVKWHTDEGLNEQNEDNWEEGRRASIIKNIQDAHLDICALQELSERTLDQIKIPVDENRFMHRSSLWKHFTEEPEGAHGVAVFFNPNRFSLVGEQGIKSSDSKFRYAACVDLKDLQNGFVYRVVSVHIKGYDPYEEDLVIKGQSQQRGDQELSEYLTACTQQSDHLDGIFILGDFNEDAEEMERRGLESRQGQLIQSRFTWTGVAYPTETRSQRQIDWIFYLDLHDGIHKVRFVNCLQDLSASDHALTVVEHQSSLKSLAQFMIT